VLRPTLALFTALLLVACERGSASPARRPAQPPLDGGAAPDARAEPEGAATDAAEGPLWADGDAARPPLFVHFPDPVAQLPKGEEQRARLCARGHHDAISDAFCGEHAPRITHLAEALAVIGVRVGEYIGAQGFALVGHSTALGRRAVSALNPRVIFMQIESENAPLLGVGFTRGEAVVEIVVRDRGDHELAFYVLAFTLPCSADHSCGPVDVLTPSFERGWQSADLYDEQDLANTAFDCAVCHQPAGPGTPKLLRMQELESPWTHWFDDQTRGGRALLADFQAAHGEETYAAIPGELVRQARAGLAAAFVRIAGYENQPGEFPSTQVESEVEVSAPGQPDDNRVRGESSTWRALYEAAQRGATLAVPYHDVKISDPDKLTRMQQAYAAYRVGSVPAARLPDIRDVYPDDPVALAEMGFLLDERLDDAALLTAACATCHNTRLDQRLSRARFHTELARLSAAEKALAVERLRMPDDHPLAMPPRRLLGLGEGARARLIALLGG
jgi:hypothetical protein